ncbi:MAG TPA: hypothetical protein VMG12_29355 [Polyangiaceae bacterium]|nr:hypothetical protein [Polyangiaceae bacterium]
MSANLTAGVQDRGSVDRGAPSERSTQFVPVEGGTSNASDAGTFMVAAYVLMWLCTVFFILHTWRKTRSVEARMSELQKAIAKLPQTGD